MKIYAVAAVALLLIPTALSQGVVTVSYDEAYDQKEGSLLTVACSDGAHGLYRRYHTFFSVPSFPRLGGVPAVAGYDSPACGSCWKLAYEDRSITVTAIDATGGKDFNIALGALNLLTGGLGKQLGRVNATATMVDSSSCGLPEEEEA